MKLFWLVFISVAMLSGCASYAPMKPVDYVNIDKFMGDWYVIANIPTFIEKEAHNALESYKLEADGSIATTFTFNDGAFDGELKTYKPTGFVKDTQNNAVWGMQFIWPFKADYRIVYLDEGYQNTIIGREARDYVWMMSRKPVISNRDFDNLKEYIKAIGYDVSKLQKVPQQWPSQ